MKKYLEIQSGDTTQPGDEWFVGGEWEEIPLLHINVSAITPPVRRPVPLAGDVQFLMAVSILVPVIVNCDGREQESIEAEAGELAYQKVLDDPRKYINYESIDWANCKVDEIQPELKIPGKYRYLEPGEIIQAGDHMKDREAFHWQYCTACIGCEILPKEPYQYRRPITEPQYRPFKKGDMIEKGDQLRIHENSEWGDITVGALPIPIDQSIIDSQDFRKLIK